jgi:hypothetical protein
MTTTRVCGRWVEARLVGLTSANGFLHGIVDFEDGASGAVFSEFLLILPADDGESAHDMCHGNADGCEFDPKP